MNGRTLPALLVVAALLATGTAIAATGAVDGQTNQVGISGSPDLDIHVPDPKINPGETNEVTIQISNTGDVRYGPSDAREVVTTARNVRVEADADGTPLTVETGQSAIGSVTENRPGEVPIAVSVPADVEAGTYELDVEIRYGYTHLQDGGVTQDRTRRMTESVEVEVDDDARFEITNATTDAQVGDRGTLEADVENVGADAARDVDVILESSSAGLGFGEARQDAARIAELAPGETATVRYDVAFASDAPVREYTLDGTVRFDTSDGLERADESPSVGVTPVGKQRFTVGDVESDLYVGEDGDVYGTVRNDGPAEARNVVVRYTDDSPNVIPIENAVSVGTLAAGESASFRLPLEIGGEAEAVDRNVDIAVQYRNAELESRLYEDVALSIDVEPKRDGFLVDVAGREIRSGETVTVDVEVTNNLDETVRDVEARLFANSPLDSDDDEAFASELAPGESTTLTFELSADSSATAKTYPVSFDFRYDDERGNSQLSDTTRVPITVVDAEESFPWLLVVGVLVVIGAAGGGYYLYARDA
ncbi:exo-alpha-sialidase [Halorubrum sp. DTA98]|uniref:COG1361 S-layer family protein n=1 Tax=Halorubrum sp. DTA98 TaxID=3402163 RepID=UPI003AAE9257